MKYFSNPEFVTNKCITATFKFMIVVRIKRESDGKMHLMPILKKVVLPSVKECMKNGGKIGMASIESSASIVVHVVIRVKSIPSSVGGCWVVGWD